MWLMLIKQLAESFLANYKLQLPPNVFQMVLYLSHTLFILQYAYCCIQTRTTESHILKQFNHVCLSHAIFSTSLRVTTEIGRNEKNCANKCYGNALTMNPLHKDQFPKSLCHKVLGWLFFRINQNLKITWIFHNRSKSQYSRSACLHSFGTGAQIMSNGNI